MKPELGLADMSRVDYGLQLGEAEQQSRDKERRPKEGLSYLINCSKLHSFFLSLFDWLLLFLPSSLLKCVCSTFGWY